MQHLADYENKAYYLAMEREFFEVDLPTLEMPQLFQYMEELNEPPISRRMKRDLLGFDFSFQDLIRRH
ncbi:MAG: hypothetical protein P8K08_06015 [Fuerstiella sp.]|nr:hypothetical protein [Fuerstiella sp.]